MFGIGKTEDLLIILLIVLLLFGAKKLPQLSRSLGQSVREVRKGFSEGADSDASSTKNNDQA